MTLINSPINTIDDIKGRTVGIRRGTLGGGVIIKNLILNKYNNDVIVKDYRTSDEVMSALARRAREQPVAAAALAAARQRFKLDWGRLAVLEITPALAELAGDYTQALALRAYDSVQLATLVTLHKRMDEEVQFACFDDRLVKAAEVLGVGSRPAL